MKKQVFSVAVLFSCCSMAGMQDDKKPAFAEEECKFLPKTMNVKKEDRKKLEPRKQTLGSSSQHKEICKSCNEGIGLYSHPDVEWLQCNQCDHEYRMVEMLLGRPSHGDQKK